MAAKCDITSGPASDAFAAPLDGLLTPVAGDAAPDLGRRVRAVTDSVDRAELEAEVLPDPT
jgi:hypothetical protein